MGGEGKDAKVRENHKVIKLKHPPGHVPSLPPTYLAQHSKYDLAILQQHL